MTVLPPERVITHPPAAPLRMVTQTFTRAEAAPAIINLRERHRPDGTFLAPHRRPIY